MDVRTKCFSCFFILYSSGSTKVVRHWSKVFISLVVEVLSLVHCVKKKVECTVFEISRQQTDKILSWAIQLNSLHFAFGKVGFTSFQNKEIRMAVSCIGPAYLKM